jgi:hypothetical protein
MGGGMTGMGGGWMGGRLISSSLPLAAFSTSCRVYVCWTCSVPACGGPGSGIGSSGRYGGSTGRTCCTGLSGSVEGHTSASTSGVAASSILGSAGASRSCCCGRRRPWQQHLPPHRHAVFHVQLGRGLRACRRASRCNSRAASMHAHRLAAPLQRQALRNTDPAAARLRRRCERPRHQPGPLWRRCGRTTRVHFTSTPSSGAGDDEPPSFRV